MDEHGNLVVRARSLRIANDQSAEEPAADVRADVVGVIVERPGADRLLRHVVDIRPPPARQDLVAARAVRASDPERPRTVGIDPVLDAVDMEAVAAVLVTVQDVDVETLAGLRVQERAGNPPVPGRLVDVGRDELVRLRDRVRRVEVLVVDECIEGGRGYLVRGDTSQLMPVVEHAVAPVVARAQDRRERAVTRKGLDLEKDVTRLQSHFSLPVVGRSPQAARRTVPAEHLTIVRA